MDDSAPKTNEAEAWKSVLANWGEVSAHRSYLDRFADLDGLVQAGRRYRAVLEESPSDPVALRWRDEIVKRATVQGLAQLPRTRPPRLSPRWVRLSAIALGVSLAVGLIGYVIVKLVRALGSSGGMGP